MRNGMTEIKTIPWWFPFFGIPKAFHFSFPTGSAAGWPPAAPPASSAAPPPRCRCGGRPEKRMEFRDCFGRAGLGRSFVANRMLENMLVFPKWVFDIRLRYRCSDMLFYMRLGPCNPRARGLPSKEPDTCPVSKPGWNAWFPKAMMQKTGTSQELCHLHPCSWLACTILGVSPVGLMGLNRRSTSR